MRILYGLRVSPWTQRARWALDHHKLPFRYHEHVPLLGEPLLRARAKVKRPTVPLLLDGGNVIMESLEIARYADLIGTGSPLFPEELDARIVRVNELGDTILDVGRARLFLRMQASPEALHLRRRRGRHGDAGASSARVGGARPRDARSMVGRGARPRVRRSPRLAGRRSPRAPLRRRHTSSVVIGPGACTSAMPASRSFSVSAACAVSSPCTSATRRSCPRSRSAEAYSTRSR